jgi:hypothetical protein
VEKAHEAAGGALHGTRQGRERGAVVDAYEREKVDEMGMDACVTYKLGTGWIDRIGWLCVRRPRCIVTSG